jgi:hypothetical protein
VCCSTRTIRKVTIDVPEVMTDCQPSENPKRSPVITQARITMVPATKAHAEERLVEWWNGVRLLFWN